MKTQIFTVALLVATLSFTSCKNNEAPQAEIPVTTTQVAPTTQAEPTAQVQDTTAKTTTKTPEKEENEANEKNDKD